MKTVFIKNGRVFDGQKFFRADILVKGNRVEKIESGISDVADYVFDASGMTVSAGLIDVHAHLGGISPDDLGMIPEMCTLPFGVTSVADASARQGGKEKLPLVAPRIAVFACAWVKDGRANFEEAEKMFAVYGSSVVGIKFYFDTNVAPMSDVKPLCEVCEYARKKGLPLMVHTTRSPVPMTDIVSELSAGDIISHAFHGGVNNASLDGFDCLREAKSKGIFTDIGFAGNVHADYAVLKNAVECGVIPDIISTDITRNSVFIRGGRYGLTMCMSMMRSLGMDEEDIFRAVTYTPARALGKAGEWGKLTVGGRADIAVLEYADEGFDITDKSGNRLTSDKGYRCVMTVCDGQMVYKR